MIVYRVPPFPLYATVTLSPLTEYTYVVSDEYATVMATGTGISDAEGALSVQIPSQKYDADYTLEIYDGEDVVSIENLSVVRPYINPATLVSSKVTLEQAKRIEGIARSIIDTATGGFYYKNTIYEFEGMGTDYAPAPYRINKVLNAWRNGEHVFDSTRPEGQNDLNLKVSRNHSAVVGAEVVNLTGAFIKVPVGHSDYLGGSGGRRGTFTPGTDYVLELETGWVGLPDDIKTAASLLIEDVACGASHLDKYVLEYDTDQYRIKYSSRVYFGTGNKTVDSILSKYRNVFARAGVL